MNKQYKCYEENKAYNMKERVWGGTYLRCVTRKGLFEKVTI